MVKAVLLAGGNGSRMKPASEIVNKHALLCYDRPMVHYPLQTLAEMGCSDVVIVVSPKGAGDIAATVKDGSEFGLSVEYRVQKEPLGVGNAIKQAQKSVEGVPIFPFMLGDCYYDPAPPLRRAPTLWWHDYDFANQHSVWSPEGRAIVEKPRVIDLGRRAVISYVYDQGVFDFIDRMEAAPSGELEIVDIHNFYMLGGANMEEYTGFFSDMGTPSGLLRAAQHEATRVL